MTHSGLFAAIASLGLMAAGCQGFYVGDGDDMGDGEESDAGVVVNPPSADAGPGSTANARPIFEATVAPILQAKCSAAGCHGGTGTSPLKFLPPSMTEYYDVVTSYDDRVIGYFDKTSAPMIKKIVPGPHYGATYSPAELDAITAWMDAEIEARSGGTQPPPGTGGTPTPGELSKQLIAEWSGCMELATWKAEGVADAWANKGSGEGPCIRCHVNGQASFIATDDDERMFNIIVTNKYFMLSYFAPDVTDLANAKMVVNYDSFYRVGNALYPHTEHPQFNPDGTAMDRLKSFYQKTMDRKLAGLCDPPRLVDP